MQCCNIYLLKGTFFAAFLCKFIAEIKIRFVPGLGIEDSSDLKVIAGLECRGHSG